MSRNSIRKWVSQTEVSLDFFGDTDNQGHWKI